MKKEQGIDILVQVANLAQAKGVLTIKDAVLVAKAIEAVGLGQEPQASAIPVAEIPDEAPETKA